MPIVSEYGFDRLSHTGGQRSSARPTQAARPLPHIRRTAATEVTTAASTTTTLSATLTRVNSTTPADASARRTVRNSQIMKKSRPWLLG